MKKIAFLTLVLLAVGGLGTAEDWPQWLGPERDGIWRENGVRKGLNADSKAKVLWRTPVSWGYAGPSVANGKVYVPDFVMTESSFDGKSQGGQPKKGKERILCLDAESGKELWKHEYEVTYSVSYPGGPRVTPTVVDGRLYFQGSWGFQRYMEKAGVERMAVGDSILRAGDRIVMSGNSSNVFRLPEKRSRIAAVRKYEHSSWISIMSPSSVPMAVSSARNRLT